MTQYPEKSNEWNGRNGMMSQLSGIPLVRFFRGLCHILEPETGETGLTVGFHQIQVLGYDTIS